MCVIEVIFVMWGRDMHEIGKTRTITSDIMDRAAQNPQVVASAVLGIPTDSSGSARRGGPRDHQNHRFVGSELLRICNLQIL